MRDHPKHAKLQDGVVFEPPPFHPDRPGLVAPVRIDPAGEHGPTRRQSRGTRWRRTSRGLFVPVTAPADLTAQRIVEAAAVLGPGDAVTGWAALHWLGAYWFGGLDADGRTPREVPLLTHRHVLGQPGFTISQDHLRFGEVELAHGLPITVPVRSVAFEARFAPTLRRAVQAIDMACYSDLVDCHEVAVYVDSLATWTGVPLARKAAALADENAWSPTEVSMRLVWTVEAERPRPLCNRPVFTLDGRHLGTPDLIDPVAGVIGQYDGAIHLVGSQRSADVEQEARYREAGLECVTMLAADLASSAAFVRRLHAAYGRAARSPSEDRRWTLEPPEWWTQTHTVARRRALSEHDRRRLLRYRRSA